MTTLWGKMGARRYVGWVDMKLTRAAQVLLLVAAGLILPVALAQQPSRIESPSKLDLTFMERQRTLLQELAATNLGRQFSGNQDRDLDLLQTLLDRRLVRGDQTQELQAMGIIMGDLLAEEFNLHWVVYKDEAGRSRGLRYRDSDFVLFPVTMISRRREVDNNASVADIYQQASDVVIANRPNLPYQ